MANRSSHRAHRPARPGFTFVELLIVMIIAGVLLSVAGLSIGKQVARDRVRRAATVVEGMLTEASTLAARRHSPVKIVLTGTALEIQDRATNAVIQSESFSATSDMRATLVLNPSIGVEIFPNGRGNAAFQVTVSGSDLSFVVSRTTTGIVRRN